jgi:hypothetical protein
MYPLEPGTRRKSRGARSCDGTEKASARCLFAARLASTELEAKKGSRPSDPYVLDAGISGPKELMRILGKLTSAMFIAVAPVRGLRSRGLGMSSEEAQAHHEPRHSGFLHTEILSGLQ